MVIKEGDKLRLVSGEIAVVSEVLKSGNAYVAEIFRKNGEIAVTVDTVLHNEISSVFVETEIPVMPYQHSHR